MKKKKNETGRPKIEIEDFKDKYLRALADYHNLEKRISGEREDISKLAVRNFVLKLLPFLDNLDKAEVFLKDDGLKMVKNQMSQVLKDEGIEEIELKGTEYDPEYAEALEIVPGESDNIILEVLQKGYKFKDRIIRPAQVKVSKKI